MENFKSESTWGRIGKVFCAVLQGPPPRVMLTKEQKLACEQLDAKRAQQIAELGAARVPGLKEEEKTYLHERRKLR
jgi:hypothetical protein